MPPAPQVPADPAARATGAARFLVPIATWTACAALLAVGLRRGAWDPFELQVLDLYRRIAVDLYGAGALAIPGEPGLPTLSDLGSGELPYTLGGLSVSALGMSEVAGRLPGLVFALAGIVVLYALVARLADRRTAVASSLVLATLPLYALQARVMFGDAVLLGSFAVALGAFGLAAAEPSWRGRGPWLGLALLALGTGALARGVLLGVAAPCLAAALGVFRADGPRARRLLSLSVGALGLVALAWSLLALERLSGTSEPLSRVLGFALFDPTPTASTFDRLVRQLGHGAFPYAAVLPFALVALARSARGPGSGRADLARLTLAGLMVGFVLSAWLVPHVGTMPLVSASLLGPALALALPLAEGRGGPSRSAALLCALLGLVLWIDLERVPDRLLAPYATILAGMPLPTEDLARTLTRVAGLAGLASIVVGFRLEDDPGRPRLGLRGALREELASLRGDVETARRRLAQAYEGNLLFFVVVFEAGLVGLAAMLFMGRRGDWGAIARLPESLGRALSMAWWALPLALVSALLLLRVGDRAALHAARRARIGGAGLVLGVHVLAAATLTLGFHPALATDVSPKDTLEDFRGHAGPGEELALLGISPSAATFYLGAPQRVTSSPRDAFEWLGADVESRRFLALRTGHLPELNAEWRAAYHQNLPVIEASGKDHLLATNFLAGRANRNPLSDWVLDEELRPQHPAQIRFQDHVEVLGYDMVDARGEPVTELVASRKYKLRLYFLVLDRIGDYRIFVHVDGRSRHNVDHDAIFGTYPTPLWLPGDRLIDETELELPASFGGSDVTIRFGFFQGKSRLVVSEGPHKDNRASLGKWAVR